MVSIPSPEKEQRGNPGFLGHIWIVRDVKTAHHMPLFLGFLASVRLIMEEEKNKAKAKA